MRALLALSLLLAWSSTASWTRRSAAFDAKVESVKAALAQQEAAAVPELSAGGIDFRTTSRLTTPEDQGNCGSCTSFAVTHTIMDYYSLKSCGRGPISQQDVLNCVISCDGSYNHVVYAFAALYGVASRQCLRYRAFKDTCSETCDDGSSMTGKRLKTAYACYHISQGYTTQQLHNAMLSWLDQGSPVTIGMMLKDDIYAFGNPTVARTGVYPSPGASNTFIGGHAMEIVGYGTANGRNYWLVKNSWGTGWGDGGYFKIARGVNEGGIEEYVCRPTGTTCPDLFAAPDAADAAAEATPFKPALEAEELTPLNPEQQDAYTGVQTGLPTPADVADPTVRDAAAFAAESLLVAPVAQNGFACLTAEQLEAQRASAGVQSAGQLSPALRSLTIHQADQKVVGGTEFSLVFTFAAAGSQCAEAQGTFAATVLLRASGEFELRKAHRTAANFSTGEEIPRSTIIAASVSSGAAVLLLLGLGAWRWRHTRGRYKQLKTVHKEVMRRVTLLEKEQGGVGEGVRKAALSQLLSSVADLDSADGWESVTLGAAPSTAAAAAADSTEEASATAAMASVGPEEMA